MKKDFDFEAIRNNDYRLQDFIRDKYERKRYINSKKEDPMSLVIQGHDLIKEYALRKESNTVEEEEEDEPRERHFVRPKAGRSFGIVSKPEDKNNIPKKTIANNTSNNNIQNNNQVQPPQTEKPKGFAFIKKKPSDKVNSTTTVLPANSIQQTQPPITQQQPELLSVSANNDTLIDLYNIESQTTEAVKKLNEQLNQAYSHPSQPVQPQIPINPMSNSNNYNIQNMNYPNININNFYSSPYVNNQKPFGYGYQTNPMMTPPMYQQPMGSPLYNIELYNDPKKEQNKVFNMNSQPVINMNYGSNQVKKDDPFKNLVSFN